ncbi:MAG: PPC domain-containing protein [Pirellulaceae bacterium]|nr:PPC domain-containing protein [Pirellulaceae bacterium]
MRQYFLAITLLLTSSLAAAPPEVTSLIPTGITRGQTAEIVAGGNLGGTWPLQVWTDNPGLTIEALADSGKLKVTAAADARLGLTWLRLIGADGASVPRPFFVGSLPEVAEVEPNNSFKERQQLSASAAISGKLQKQNDVDVFSIPAQAGQTLVASAIANELLGSPMDAVLQICSESGTVLVQDNDSHGLDPQVTYTVPQAGNYLVRIFAFPSEPNSTIAFAGGDNYVYRLTITTGGYADHALPLAVQRGKPTDLKLHGWNLPTPAAILDVPAGDLCDLLFFQPPDAAGLVPLLVTSHPSLVADITASRETPQECPLPCILSGRLDEPKDSDVFRFTAVKGKALSIKAESDSIGYEVDPFLRVTDDAGKVLAEAESPRRGGEPVLKFTPPADGPYRLEIADLHRRGGLRYAYRITLAPVTPDFTVTLAAGTFSIVPGKTLEIPLTIDRQNGFAAEIDFTPENLPAGITAAPLKSLPTGDTAKTAKLVLTAAADAKPGMFQLLAKSAGDVPLMRRVTYSVKQGPSTFNHGDVWLSIGK